MSFAPYQQEEPSIERAKSPPLRSPNASPKPQQPTRNISSVADREDPWAAARAQRLPDPSTYAEDEEDSGGYQDLESGSGPRRYNDYIVPTQTPLYSSGAAFETSLGIPLRVEAVLAYLLLPPAGGVVLLLFEHKSDYVRFHAWQSALLFSAIFLVHVIFSWTKTISWILFVGDMLLIAYLVVGAWRNAETLDRVEMPIFGRLASGFVDDE